ncbi:MAG: hypothetical protein RML33_11000 [Acidobacteriota bacterium]|nr:hypothetical protein [Acidobacteriota bacterium]
MILFSCFSQINSSEQAEAILEKSLTNLGGEKYLQIKTIFSQGNFTIFRDGTPFLIQTFIDIVVLPNKERTDFKSSGEKIVQVNVGNSGWIGDTATQSLRDQSPEQVKNFIKSIRTSIHNLLSRNWKTEGAKISYIGKREASVGKRNDVVKLSYPDGFEVEFEFSSEGLPVKVLYKTKSSEGEEVVEEDRYAQFIEVQGVLTPFIIDHYKNGIQVSRINFTEVVYNKPVPEQIFQKPKSIKELKRTPRL